MGGIEFEGLFNACCTGTAGTSSSTPLDDGAVDPNLGGSASQDGTNWTEKGCVQYTFQFSRDDSALSTDLGMYRHFEFNETDGYPYGCDGMNQYGNSKFSEAFCGLQQYRQSGETIHMYQHVEEFADDQQAWIDAFIPAMEKMMRNGQRAAIPDDKACDTLGDPSCSMCNRYYDGRSAANPPDSRVTSDDQWWCVFVPEKGQCQQKARAQRQNWEFEDACPAPVPTPVPALVPTPVPTPVPTNQRLVNPTGKCETVKPASCATCNQYSDGRPAATADDKWLCVFVPAKGKCYPKSYAENPGRGWETETVCAR